MLRAQDCGGVKLVGTGGVQGGTLAAPQRGQVQGGTRPDALRSYGVLHSSNTCARQHTPQPIDPLPPPPVEVPAMPLQKSFSEQSRFSKASQRVSPRIQRDPTRPPLTNRTTATTGQLASVQDLLGPDCSQTTSQPHRSLGRLQEQAAQVPIRQCPAQASPPAPRPRHPSRQGEPDREPPRPPPERCPGCTSDQAR